ncbi:serine/threonine protein kinase [Enhygromyxa salina]|uniref:non-specific serine/threonine protein kinase n=1 Tax=Enhygromyxa salina TaxID=215803 RepID=A0A0C1Z3S7_9BACT|nr:serine/threonine-protein kinase [Enhygromyxa salina]KIG12289.1 serine/threonine protein kinase [Enhygromyxa salina]
MPSLAGQKLDKYDMLEEVGHGGMAVVYRGRDTILDREVAVKVLHAHLADREESRRRLQREAKTVARLHHDNIVEIFDSSDPSRAHESYIVCEFIHGVTLRDWLDDRWVPHPVLAAMITHRLCLPLEHAHSLGIVHRDIKPENVMIREDGCLKLMDFGIAQILDTQRLTTTGQLLGSPAYMAPELIKGGPVDKRIDIFALGVMLYQLATGELPFAGRNPAQVLNRILEGDYKPPRQVDPKVDEDLAAIIATALALKPADRYQSANSLAKALEGYLQSLAVEALPEELAAYFANPERYTESADARVCRELTRRAARAMRDGNGARALKLLARVLELEPNNKRAAAMLDKVRIRGQRMRQAMAAGGAVALVGIVAAGVLLLQPDPPTPGRVHSQELGADSSSRNYIIPGLDPLERPPVVTETETDGGEAGDGTETGDPEADAGSDGGSRPNGGGRPDASVPCTVHVQDLPASLLAGGDYHLLVPKQGIKPLSASGKVQIDITEYTTVRLTGASYTGSAVLAPDDCRTGDPQILLATSKPAQLVFQPGAIPLTQLIVSCLEGCGADKRTANNFPKLNFQRGETEMVVKLEFKSAGYRSKTEEFKLTPGINPIRINLEKFDE